MKKPEKRQPKIVSRVKIADAVTDEIRQLILSGEIADGSPLRQDALAEQMGTSRIPVREALSRLESEGLVASFPHKGYVVTGLSRSDIEELFDLRTMLEPDLIRHAIANMTEDDLAIATSILAEYDAALLTGDVDTWGDLNRRFHMALYAPSGRSKTLDIVRGLLVNADRYTRLVLTVGYGIDKAQEDHGGLLDLCRRGLVNQAVALTRDHIERTGADLLEMLDARDREDDGKIATAVA
ncbi:transcriptional regulator, GntR family [Sphingopyxis sp. YR583]|uniref:GntR family transcriptional regulator n=1 Tax=Sphingopyxis sp. YR583 TaxID=1881047 RepID=UPI0008A78C7A|nr:GntR family transcriptional regulator [Sphingopyxis sp. YR583]SEH13855.1 transcriptional regulator, GntR family [Sphingopyxis sp. YR583]